MTRGLPEMPIEDVTLDGLSINLDPNNTVGGSPAKLHELPLLP